MQRDYKNYDYIEIIIKKDNAEEVISSYKKFLWQELERNEDARYSDILHVSFCRAHKIKNKDRLQLLQVYYEFALNERANLSEKKHHKSKAGICNLIIFTICLLFGVWWLIFYIKELFVLIGGIFFSMIIVALVFIFVEKLKKLYKRENQLFRTEDERQKAKIREIFDEVKMLSEKDEGEMV